jgi:ribosomal protein S18 acetylase RimI-like enzyme
MQHTASIWGMYVQPEWRGQGLGERLLEANVDWARRNDVRIVRLAVVADNGPAIRCYLKQGFTVYGVEPEALYYEGRYLDELWMARRV